MRGRWVQGKWGAGEVKAYTRTGIRAKTFSTSSSMSPRQISCSCSPLKLTYLIENAPLHPPLQRRCM